MRGKNMNHRWTAFLAGLMLFPSLMSFAATADDAGTAWLKIPPSARVAAMGGAFGALAEGVDALVVNPAGLAGLSGPQAIFTHSFWDQGVVLEQLAYGQNLSKGSGGAVGLDYLNFGSVSQYTLGANGAPVLSNSYSPSAFNFHLGYGCELTQGLRAGGTAKFLLQGIQTTSSATVAFDAGFLYRVAGIKGLSFAAVMSNLGGKLDNASLPLQVKLAGAYQTKIGSEMVSGLNNEPLPKNLLTLTVDGDIDLSGLGFTNFRMGGEYWFDQLIAARVGYRLAPYGTLTGLTGLSAGAGVRYQNWELSYALTTQGDMGATHQISLGARF